MYYCCFPFGASGGAAPSFLSVPSGGGASTITTFPMVASGCATTAFPMEALGGAITTAFPLVALGGVTTTAPTFPLVMRMGGAARPFLLIFHLAESGGATTAGSTISIANCLPAWKSI